MDYEEESCRTCGKPNSCAVDTLPKHLEEVNHILMQQASGLDHPGLFNGKMGLSLYFFYLARHTSDPSHQSFAETLLDEVYEHIQKNKTTYGFADGLAGIAWAIVHLIEHQFVEAHADEILSDADDQIYYHLHQPQEVNLGFADGLMGYLCYVISRIRWRRSAGVEDDFLFERLLVELWNRAGGIVDDRRWRLEEPPFFNLNWDLPALLLLLGATKSLSLYTSKIEKIINSLGSSVLSYFPRYHANKLYLLYSITDLLQHFDLPAWEFYGEMIEKHIAPALLLDKELRDRNIFLSNGLAGLYFILQAPALSFINGRGTELNISRRIQQSQYFQSIIKGEQKGSPNLGLLNGLTGIAFQLLWQSTTPSNNQTFFQSTFNSTKAGISSI